MSKSLADILNLLSRGFLLAQVFSEDGSFQISSQELIKHFKTSKWKVPKHELTDVKDFYDYIENPGTSCAAYALLGKEHVQDS